jgi:phosphoglucosamine mutase
VTPVRFGTDGVRGPAGVWPLDADGAYQIGLALADWALGAVAVGCDTRESSPMLVAALMDGLVGGGAHAVDAGVLPTAALSCLVAARPDLRAAAMVTASHNPWQDNGVKVLVGDGTKLLDPTPLEARVGSAPTRPGGHRSSDPDPLGPWTALLPDVDLRGTRILLDCANGAAWQCAPAAFRARGAVVVERGCLPDGRNINEGVGALHPPDRAALGDCDLAICFDGDADRLVMVDAVHGTYDGDDLLGILASADSGPVVGTVMTNGGLEAALAGRLLRAQVGDRWVADMMRQSGARLGGETSGHLLIADLMPTGDGAAAALQVLAVCAKGGRLRLPLPARPWLRLPQALLALRLPAQDPRWIVGLASERDANAAGHRTVVRFSGTEPKLRIMVEGQQATEWAQRIAAEVLERCGAPQQEIQ